MNIKMHNYKQKQMAWCWGKVRLGRSQSWHRGWRRKLERAGQCQPVRETAGNPPALPSQILKALRLRDPGPGSSCGFSSEMEQNGGCETLEPGWPRWGPKLRHLLTTRPQARSNAARSGVIVTGPAPSLLPASGPTEPASQGCFCELQGST